MRTRSNLTMTQVFSELSLGNDVKPPQKETERHEINFDLWRLRPEGKAQATNC